MEKNQNNHTVKIDSEKIKLIPFPADTPHDFEQIKHKKILLKLADYFWNQVSDMHQGRHVWIETRDLVAWIFLRLDARVEVEMSDSVEILAGSNEKSSDKLFFERDMVEKSAMICSTKLNEKEKRVFYLNYYCKLTLKETAEIMNYAGPSGVSPILESVTHKIKGHLIDQDYLSPDDINKEAFSFFMEKLGNNLKNSLPETFNNMNNIEKL